MLSASRHGKESGPRGVDSRVTSLPSAVSVSCHIKVCAAATLSQEGLGDTPVFTRGLDAVGPSGADVLPSVHSSRLYINVQKVKGCIIFSISSNIN